MLAEGPDETECAVTAGGVLRIPPRIREYYLTPDAADDGCLMQAAGTRLHIWVWSDRHNVRLDVEMAGFRAERPFERTIHRWGVNVSRYDDDPGIPVDEGSVPAAVETFEGERDV